MSDASFTATDMGFPFFNRTVILSEAQRSRRTCGKLHPPQPSVPFSQRVLVVSSPHLRRTILPKEDPVIRRIVAAALLTCGIALAQSTPVATAPPAPTPVPAKPLAFEVVSIRPAKPGAYATVNTGVSPEGYTVPSQPLIYTILMAYFPQGFAYWSNARFSGAPHWLNDQYEINAKVSEADLAEWQKQGKTLDKEPMLRQMLQAMLADRCHLVAHTVPGPPIAGFSLELGKRAPRITESKPGETLPVGGEQSDGGAAIQLTGGGVVVAYHKEGKSQMAFHGATMADLAEFVSEFVLNVVYDSDAKGSEDTFSSDDPGPLGGWGFDALDLRVAPIEIPADTLVIDHIEPPSEN
jgi:uncharacterized protein (TIGR03435 family)